MPGQLDMFTPVSRTTSAPRAADTEPQSQGRTTDPET